MSNSSSSTDDMPAVLDQPQCAHTSSTLAQAHTVELTQPTVRLHTVYAGSNLGCCSQRQTAELLQRSAESKSLIRAATCVYRSLLLLAACFGCPGMWVFQIEHVTSGGGTDVHLGWQLKCFTGRSGLRMPCPGDQLCAGQFGAFTAPLCSSESERDRL